MAQYKVSIICLAYNQEKYIKQALDGFLEQSTDFNYEILVHDDASTDNTKKIIEEYVKRFPDKIKAFFESENQFQQGKDVLKIMISHVSGEYVYINDGDDYWIDPHKLEKQVCFLDNHPDFFICFHPVKVIWEDINRNKCHEKLKYINNSSFEIFPTAKYRFNKTELHFEDLCKHNFIQTNSALYRWAVDLDNWPVSFFVPADYFLHLLHANRGKIGFIPDVMSVYRRNSGGIWTGSSSEYKWFKQYGLKHARFYRIIMDRFEIDKTHELIELSKKAICSFIINKDWDSLINYCSEFNYVADEILKSDATLRKKSLIRLKNLRKILFYSSFISILLIIQTVFFLYMY